MRLLLRALGRLGEDIDLLAYGHWNTPPADGIGDAIRADMKAQWGVELRSVYVRPSRRVADRTDSLWHGYLKPAMGLAFQPAYARFWGREPTQHFLDVLSVSGASRIFVHKLPSMGPLRPLPALGLPIALDLDDIEHKSFARMVRLPPMWGAKRLMRAWIPAIERGEREALERATVSFVCSDLDGEYLSSRWGLRSVRVVPNALPEPEVTTALPSSKTALFVGSHTYEPNRVGAEFLIDQVWPRVRARHPDALLVIAGRGCEQIGGFARGDPGVDFRGFVDDLAALYAQTRVACSPIFSGGGTRVKIIEAALYGRPVVSTTLGAEGLDLDPARGEILLADNAADFATKICNVFEDQDMARTVALRGAECARRHYTEERVISRIGSHLRETGWVC
jgi:glycosyltransferase involved in cell wall biosynthesis